MGYFPSGSCAMDYEEAYCVRCIHNQDPENGCAVLLAHLLYNYEECDKESSILHLLIPRTKDGFGNEQCKMFAPAPDELLRCTADEKYRQWQREREAQT